MWGGRGGRCGRDACARACGCGGGGGGWGGGGVFLLEVQYSVLKSLISTCVLSYVGSKERIGYLTESASLKRTAGIV